GIQPMAERYIPPIYFARIDGRFYLGWIGEDLSKPAGFPEGEECLEIDGAPVAQLYSKFEAMISASTPQALCSRILAGGLLLAGSQGSRCCLKIGSGEELSFERSVLRFETLPWLRRDESRIH